MPGELPDELAPAASAVFGAELPRAQLYARLLATDGLTRGLLGPREADRLWERHLLNSAVVGELVPSDSTVTDVGSGAGLPGIPLALARPDLSVALLEPMLRRCTFLQEVLAALDLTGRVAVVRGRAPEDREALPFSCDYVAARAVAPLERLVSWTMPLVRPDGALLALRGLRANEEVRESGDAVRALAGTSPEVLEVGRAVLPDTVTVVRVVRRTNPSSGRPRTGTRRRRSR